MYYVYEQRNNESGEKFEKSNVEIILVAIFLSGDDAMEFSDSINNGRKMGSESWITSEKIEFVNLDNSLNLLV